MQFFTYQDVNGRRKPRRFVTAAGFIALSLIAAAWLGSRARLPAHPDHENQPGHHVHDHTATSLPIPTQAQPSTPTPFKCPIDPADWQFVEVFPGDNYRRIEPGCVYTGVAKTAAWMLAERMGYSKSEAAVLLEFSDLPWMPVPVKMAYSNLEGPTARALVAEWPANPDFHFWQVDREGRPAVSISLRGCYRLDDSAFCVLALDREPGSAINYLGAHAFASHAAHLPATRSFTLLEYRGNGAWNLLGQFSDAVIEIPEPDRLSEDRDQVSDRFGTDSWDADWLDDTFGLSMKPLPAGWRLLGMDEQAVQAISDELNRVSPAVHGEDDA